MYRYDNLTFMICLPRSRSAWMSHFLKPIASTRHDPLKHCASIDELGDVIDRIYDADGRDAPVFIADTAAVLFFDELGARFPNARYLFVERDVARVAESLRKAGMGATPGFYELMARAYAHALIVAKARNDFMLEVPFDQIDRRLLNIWRFVGANRLLDLDYAERMKNKNIQIPFDEQIRNTNPAKVGKLLYRFNPERIKL